MLSDIISDVPCDLLDHLNKNMISKVRSALLMQHNIEIIVVSAGLGFGQHDLQCIE